MKRWLLLVLAATLASCDGCPTDNRPVTKSLTSGPHFAGTSTKVSFFAKRVVQQQLEK